MAAIDALKTAWEAEIGHIAGHLQRARATYLLDRYIAAVQKQAALEANEIVSYSIAGRTVTRRDTGAGEAAIAKLERDLSRMVYGSTSLVDMNRNTSRPRYP